MRILAIAVLLSSSSFAFAQRTTVETTTSGSSYYIVQDAGTKRCTITRERPTTPSMTIVGSDGTIYKTETEARSAIKTTKVCVTD